MLRTYQVYRALVGTSLVKRGRKDGWMGRRGAEKRSHVERKAKRGKRERDMLWIGIEEEEEVSNGRDFPTNRSIKRLENSSLLVFVPFLLLFYPYIFNSFGSFLFFFLQGKEFLSIPLLFRSFVHSFV